MSWWTCKKGKDGKVYVTSTDITSFFFPFMIFLGFFAVQFVINPTGTTRFLLWGGFLCLLAAKISLFRRGVWISWGTGQMTRRWSRIYKLGYVLMGIGALIAVAGFRTTH